jgi:poly-gamma-glutamate synthesis protein (capsule biosynthesis protein)
VQAQNRPVVLRFAGDLLMAGHYEAAADTNGGLAFEGFTLLRDADLAMVNLECPITTRGTRVEKPYNFRMRPSYVGAVRDAGIDIVNLANNHVFDYGAEGFFDTMANLDSAGILRVGAGRNSREAHRPLVLELEGKRFAFLGYYGGGEAPAATPDSPGVARRAIDLVSRDIRRARTRDSADVVIVTFHWGEEKAEFPDPQYVKFGRATIDAGADLIIGHHPHVLQGVERHKDGVIVYSLGNFVFGGNARHSHDTAVFEAAYAADTVSYRFIPVGVRQWRAEVLSGRDSLNVVETLRARSAVFTTTIDYTSKEQE